MRALTMALAALVGMAGFSAGASAQETARFVSRVGGGAISGTESYTIADTPAGRDLTATVTLKRGGSESTLTLRESFDRAWAAERYEVNVSGAMGAASATAERRQNVLALAVKTPAGSPTLSVPVTPRQVLMENLVAAPYQVLLNVTGGEPGAITVVVPFQMVTVGATLEDGGAVDGTLDGKPIAARKLLLKVAGVTTEVCFDPATRRLLRVYTPGQDAELRREGFELAGASAPKPAAPPAGVTERTVTFKQIDGAPYPAVLCLPKAPSPAPLVVMLQGSGPNDRDETIGPNKPFRDIAWGLAERGVASLRYDKRTYAFPKAYTGTLDSESIDDGVDAVKFAATLPGIDHAHVYVLGHSLGGLAAIYVAERVRVAGLVLMATAGRTMDKVIRDQVKELAAGRGDAALEETLQMQDRIMAKVRAGTATAAELRGQPPATIRDMIVRDPIAELEKTHVPLLVLRGDQDAQTFPEDFDALAAVAAKRPGSASRAFPGLTHIFTPTGGAGGVRAIFEPGHVSPAVIATIASWITTGSLPR